ncbi:MAG TPA: 23S ribosomal RNA methyltransferase Erm [Amycolatopsis sp.]|nr:23S ribosomal RNA methyltransferase Erm [Amycolatopsis sp.]
MPYRNGRHELGQNFLTDPAVVDAVVAAVGRLPGPIVEIGAGEGALTVPLQGLGRPVTAIEVDPRLATGLRASVDPALTRVVCEDFLRHRLPRGPHVLVGNLPFHQTTAILRKILHSGQWTAAVLLVQWEVARRRAAIGGATMMTAQWWPWFEFAVARRVPAAAFTPSPGVDGGLLTVRRRVEPLVPADARPAYQAFAHAVFTGRGRGLPGILPRLGVPPVVARRFRGLPKDLAPEQWAELFATVRVAGRPRARTRPSSSRTR